MRIASHGHKPEPGGSSPQRLHRPSASIDPGNNELGPLDIFTSHEHQLDHLVDLSVTQRSTQGSMIGRP